MRYTSMVLVCLLYTFLHSMQCWYACHACFKPPVWISLLLCLFARLPTCSCMSLCVVRTQSNGTMDTWSKPTFFLLGHPLLFDNMFVCSFICVACFVCPRLAFFGSMFFACSPYLLCSFLCLEQGCDLPGTSKKGKDASPQRVMISRLKGHPF